MKKSLKISLVIVAILFVCFIFLGQTNWFKIYNIPTIANDPGMKLNSKIIASNLVAFENGDFVCYKYNNEMMGEHIRVHRLFGRSTDIVEIRNSILYLNGNNVDEQMDLKHLYIINSSDFKNLMAKASVQPEDIVVERERKFFLFLTDHIAKQNGLASNLKIEPKNQPDKIITEVYSRDWNQDNFGPLKIPKGKCFVIGDNRHNSEDSRFIGLIDEVDIVGTVVMEGL